MFNERGEGPEGEGAGRALEGSGEERGEGRGDRGVIDGRGARDGIGSLKPQEEKTYPKKEKEKD
jgi:hypothetical protein